MNLAASLGLLIAGAPLLIGPLPIAVAAVPDTPGGTMLPEAVTYEVVVADVDGDRVGDIVRLVDMGDGAIGLEAWRVSGEGVPERIGEAIGLAPRQSELPTGSLVYADTPHRLVARRVDGVMRATLVRRPRFEEPGLEMDCCILLHDVIADGNTVDLVEVAEPGLTADAVLAIDMDGDATDELLVTRGLTPLGQTTFPTEARVLRWAGARFGPPTVTALGVGSGASPFVLGDTDGVPGDEAAFIAAESRLHRISLRAGDTLVAESTDAGIRDAAAVPIGDGRGIATVSLVDGTTVREWPRDAPRGEPVGSAPIYAGSIAAVAEIDGAVVLGIKRPDRAEAVLLTLPGLEWAGLPADDGPSAGLADGPARAYVGQVMGGATDPAVIAFGNTLLVGQLRISEAPLAGVRPVGLAGPGGDTLVLWHGDWLGPGVDPRLSLLFDPEAPAGSAVSVVPVASMTADQADWRLEPVVTDAIGDGEGLVVADDGFVATIAAPAGSRVYLTDGSETERSFEVVPDGGELEVRVPIPAEPGPGGPRVELAVVTPAGRAYATSWALRVLADTPQLAARTATSIGSGDVQVRGTTDPESTVTVMGEAVQVGAGGRFRTAVALPPWPTTIEIRATDPLGRSASMEVVGVGWFDYRGLPWIAMAAVLVAVGGGLLTIRGARATPEPAVTEEAATLEELDPEEF